MIEEEICPLRNSCVFIAKRYSITKDQGHHAELPHVYCPKLKMHLANPGLADHEWCNSKAVINGSTAHITAIFGFTIAGLVIQEICKQ